MPKQVNAIIICPNHLTLALGSHSRGILIDTYRAKAS